MGLLVLRKRRRALGDIISQVRAVMLCHIIARVRTAPALITTAQRETTIPTPAKKDTQAPTNLGGKLWKEKATRGPSHLL